ncbi:unnamed protein product [Oikopleura dioica]|uniref:Uncharacterized protein n=1 Tax=Oikopleura dioica TaxID=34765 RepID=E4XMW9_OIKDI|nr:unnamed protein product [Oikopleura dioica]
MHVAKPHLWCPVRYCLNAVFQGGGVSIATAAGQEGMAPPTSLRHYLDASQRASKPTPKATNTPRQLEQQNMEQNQQQQRIGTKRERVDVVMKENDGSDQNQQVVQQEKRQRTAAEEEEFQQDAVRYQELPEGTEIRQVSGDGQTVQLSSGQQGRIIQVELTNPDGTSNGVQQVLIYEPTGEQGETK